MLIQGECPSCGRYFPVGNLRVIFPVHGLDGGVRRDVVVVEVPLQKYAWCFDTKPSRPALLHLGSFDHFLGSRATDQDELHVVLIGRDVDDPGKIIIPPGAAEGNALKIRVVPSDGSTLPAYASGIWGDPDRPGEGMSVLALDEGTIFIYFGHDDEGNSLWLLSDLIPHDGSREGKLFKAKNRTFEQPSDDLEEWGGVRFSKLENYELCSDSVRFELIQNEVVVKVMNLTRIAAPRSQPDCVVSPR